MQKIFTLIKGACVKAVFVTATFYKPFCNELYHRFPRMKESVHVISDSLNLANYRVKYTFVRYSANSTERVEYLLRFLQGGRDLKTIIFCNTLRTAALLSSLLSKSRISHSYWNGSLLYTQRRQALQNFKEEGGVIVATDSLGRGLDFVNAQVVLFDFPRSVEEWVHRVGRTGRARSQGRVLCFYCKKSALLACEISNALNQGSLAALSSRVELPREFYFRAGDPKYYNKRRIIEGKDGRKVVFRPMPSPFYSQESASSASIEKIQNSDVKAKRVHVKIIDIRPSAIEKRRNKKGIRLSCHSSSSTATYRKARSPPSEGRMSRSLGNKRLDHLKKFQIYE
ncbi:uncharacterized protein LOC135120404 [Zophobas morio]|uniref:uncharacterized protein LOC135120404 n=1 Tax=Zophobas morio TaxID=2755281 RepID=UPI0030838385